MEDVIHLRRFGSSRDSEEDESILQGKINLI